MRSWRSIREVSEGHRFFSSNFQEYRIETTSNSVGFTAGRFSWHYSLERFWPKYLRELSKVKSEVKRNIGNVEGINPPPLRSFRVNRQAFSEKSGSYDAEELDLSRAYLTAAGLLGLISPETEKRIGALRKVWRLRLLGAIARRKSVKVIRAGAVVESKTVEDRELRRGWACICQLVDNVQRQLADKTGERFLFYWYDNLFTRPGAFSPAVLECCSEFSYKITEGAIQYKSRPESLAVKVSGGRVFWLPSLRAHSVGAFPILSPVDKRKLLTA